MILVIYLQWQWDPIKVDCKHCRAAPSASYAIRRSSGEPISWQKPDDRQKDRKKTKIRNSYNPQQPSQP